MKIDRIETLPVETEKPVVSEALRRNRVIDVVVFGDVSEKALKEKGMDAGSYFQ